MNRKAPPADFDENPPLGAEFWKRARSANPKAERDRVNQIIQDTRARIAQERD